MPRRGRPWTAEEKALLGTLSDKDLAAHLGRTVSSVRQHRMRAGIAMDARSYTEEELALLGTDTDPNIAKRIGKTTASVYQMRRSKFIPAFRPAPRRVLEDTVAWARERPRTSEEVAERYGAYGRKRMRAAGATFSRATGVWRLK